MEKRINKALLRAESIITKYKDDESVYYQELKKSYKELKHLELPDKTTQELYVEHIERLCDFIVQKKHANIMIAIMSIFFIFMVCITIYTSYRYYDMSTNLKNNIIKANRNTSLIVNYKNLENFDAVKLSNETEYKDLTPITLSVLAKSEDKDSYKVHYDVYIIEENDVLEESNIINRDVFLYNVYSNTRDTGIKSLKDASIKDNKILLFSGEIETNKTEDISIRMWIDSKTDKSYLNKKYRFKLYVDGYVI